MLILQARILPYKCCIKPSVPDVSVYTKWRVGGMRRRWKSSRWSSTRSTMLSGHGGR